MRIEGRIIVRVFIHPPTPAVEDAAQGLQLAGDMLSAYLNIPFFILPLRYFRMQSS
jgi:hypothetical protein